MAGGSGETFVTGEQRGVEHFGQGDVHGVIGREMVPQIPDARQQDIVRIPVQRKVCEVSESHAAALGINLAVCGITANHLRNFDVEQMRRVQRPGRIEQPLLYRACGKRAKKYSEHSRGRIVIYIT